MNEETRGGFCGHRNEYEIPVGATERIRMQIVRRYRSGVSEFWLGGMGWDGLDRACEQTVRKPYSSGEIGQDAQLWLFVITNMLFLWFPPAAQRRKGGLGGWGGIMLFVSVVFGKAALFGEAVRNCVDTPLCGVFMLNSKDGRDYCFFAVKGSSGFCFEI